MGAYYTKEDITDYITKNTVVPWLFQNAIGHDKVAFEPGGFVWRLLSENPDTYIYPSVRHGMDSPLPDEIAAGIADVSQRGDWNKTAPREFGLPTEIWREVVARRERYEATRSKAASGEITSIEDFITYNLDIRQFARDVIQYAESPDVVRAFWKGISSIKILDPACGSGAFLFAALNILYDLYDACLERMEQFVATAPDSGSGRGQPYSDFHAVLDQIAQHPNRDYFIYKSIIIANLYGVDIMDEAVEICKLRLFLKLASQLETPAQIEPLPDIDFNIRAGNTLIGYTSIDDVEKAAKSAGFDFDNRASKIEAAAQDLDHAFRLFREQHTKLRGEIGVGHKSALRNRLRNLEAQLDRFLANDYGIKVGNDESEPASFAAWKITHKPFHWLVEFYGIMKSGGFDVVVGNPPYIEMKSVTGYVPKGYLTQDCGNLYALFMERGEDISGPKTKLGYIVPVSSISAERYESLQSLTLARHTHISSFDDRPSRLFDGLEHIRLAIHIVGEPSSKKVSVFTTKYNRWFGIERARLFECLEFSPSTETPIPGTFPKVGDAHSASILHKLLRQKRTIGHSSTKLGKHFAYYTRKVGHFLQFLGQPPRIWDEQGNLREPSELKAVRFESEALSLAAVAVFNSSLFYWFFTTFSDCRNVNKRDVEGFPIDLRALTGAPNGEKLIKLGRELAENLVSTAEIRQMSFKKAKLRIECIFPSQSKSIIDKIDQELGSAIGLNENEVDFIKSYFVKYRIGADESG